MMDGLGFYWRGGAGTWPDGYDLLGGIHGWRAERGKVLCADVAMVGSIIGLGCATDLFNLWVWFEAMAITSYTLVAFYRSQKDALEAGVKYLVQSASGSVLVLLGISLVFAQTGELELAAIRPAAGNPTPLWVPVRCSWSDLGSRRPWSPCTPGCRMPTPRRRVVSAPCFPVLSLKPGSWLYCV